PHENAEADFRRIRHRGARKRLRPGARVHRLARHRFRVVRERRQAVRRARDPCAGAARWLYRRAGPLGKPWHAPGLCRFALRARRLSAAARGVQQPERHHHVRDRPRDPARPRREHHSDAAGSLPGRLRAALEAPPFHEKAWRERSRRAFLLKLRVASSQFPFQRPMAQYVYTMIRVGKVVPPKRQILKNISLSFHPGAKIGLLGLNGAGKSTILRIMAGEDKDYEGEATPMPGIRIGYLAQEPQLEPGHTVREAVEEGLGEVFAAKKRLDQVYAAYAEPDADFDKLAAEQEKLEK